jgi:hypothetical protein
VRTSPPQHSTLPVNDRSLSLAPSDPSPFTRQTNLEAAFLGLFTPSELTQRIPSTFRCRGSYGVLSSPARPISDPGLVRDRTGIVPQLQESGYVESY